MKINELLNLNSSSLLVASELSMSIPLLMTVKFLTLLVAHGEANQEV